MSSIQRNLRIVLQSVAGVALACAAAAHPAQAQESDDAANRDAKVTGSSGFMGLDKAAQMALTKCSFQPALENGKAVQKWTYVKYVWTLG